MKQERTKGRQVCLWTTEEKAKRLKLLCVERDTTIQAVLERAIDDFLLSAEVTGEKR